MTTPHTWGSRAATVAGALLAVLELGWASRTSHLPLAMTAGLLALVTAACVVRLLRANCFEARLTLAVLGSLQLGMGLLAVTVGLPGQSRMQDDAMAVATIVVGGALLGLLFVDNRLRAAQGARDYAR